MKPRLAKQIPQALCAAIVGGLVFWLGFAALGEQAKSRKLQEREAARHELEIAARHLAREIEALRTAAEAKRTQRSGMAPEDSVAPTIDFLELAEAVGISRLASSTMNVALVDDAGEPLLRTLPWPLEDGVSAPVPIGGTHWQLHGAPTRGWADGGVEWPALSLLLLVAGATALGVWRLAAEPPELRERIRQLKGELEAKDSDISRLQHSRSQIEHQLVTSLTVDLYTGLPNRASFNQHLQARLAATRQTADGGVLVTTVMLHKLGELGHSMGSSVAEEVMRQTAERLQRVYPDAYIARTGECELALCFALAKIRDTAEAIGRLLRCLEERFMIDGRTVYVGAVIGLATSSDGYQHGPDLLAQSALAANMAIADGQHSAVFRTEEKNARVSLLQLEADLRSAIDSNNLQLFFQPIVSVTAGHVVGFEALLRWQHPGESWIGPDRFIPLAESMGQMARISDWVLRQGVAHASQFLGLRNEPLYVTVNLTPRDLNRELCNRLFALLDSSGLPSECFRIEVTETAVVRDFRIAARLISELNERGVRVLLDDFGTGYSSLSYLRDLPFHAVKIDKSFIHRMTTDARDFGLVKSIVGLVHYLGMECVAEGIETQEQLDLIAMMDCNYWQGYLFSRPIPASQIPPLLSSTQSQRGALRGVS